MSSFPSPFCPLILCPPTTLLSAPLSLPLNSVVSHAVPAVITFLLDVPWVCICSIHRLYHFRNLSGILSFYKPFTRISPCLHSPLGFVLLPSKFVSLCLPSPLKICISLHTFFLKNLYLFAYLLLGEESICLPCSLGLYLLDYLLPRVYISVCTLFLGFISLFIPSHWGLYLFTYLLP